MRYPKLLPGLAAISLLALMAVVFIATRSGPPPAAQRFERRELQEEDAEDAEREARGPLAPVEAQREPIVVLPAAFGTIESLKDVPAVPFKASTALSRSEEPELPRHSPSGVSGPDAVAQTWAGTIDMPPPLADFDGISLADQGRNFSPPDPNGDIGYDPATGQRYYFQWINMAYKAWEVTHPDAPVVVVPATQGNALWQAALPGTPCAINNDGDPLVLFDEQAHRWFISQFSVSTPFHQCVAVSKTANPAGAWYVYDYPYRDGATYFNDYPHFGVWPDAAYNAYYMTVHEFDAAGNAYLGQSASAFDRARLLNGNSAAPLVTFALGTSYLGMLPADLDGPPPASGTPGFFFMTDATAATLQIWDFKPDWGTPANSIFGVGAGHMANDSLAIATYTDACTVSTCALVPQAGTAKRLDSLGDRLMHRVAFRVLSGGLQTAVFNHTVDVDGSGGSNRTGIRWYEARRNPASGAWSINQQSTYAPGTTDYRWMGSIATDQAGNIALGYSASSSSMFPAIRYAGRLFTDALNQLPQAEVTLTVSAGAQTGSDRWGDYSMMGVDPQDGCTFWYTQEYNGATASLPWKTRIGSFKFAGCAPVSTGNLSGTVRSAANNNPVNGAAIAAMDSLGATYAVTTDVSGTYRLIGLPIGTYIVTAAAGGFNPGTATGVTVSASVTTTQNFTLTALLQADLSLIKTASASSIAPGGALAYTLTVTNNGPDAVTGTVTVIDVLPASYVVGTATGADWACSGTATIVCTRTGLGAGASAGVNIRGTAPLATGVITNMAVVGSNLGDNVPANNTTQFKTTILPGEPTYGVTLTPGTADQSGLPGAVVTHTLSVTNTGNAIDTFTVTIGGNAFVTGAPAIVGPLSAGGSAPINVRVTIPPGAAAGTLDTANVKVTSQGDGTQRASANASLTTTVVWFSVYLPVVLHQPF